MGGTVAKRAVGRKPVAWPESGPLPESALTEGTRLTFDEYCRTPETNRIRELVFGVVREGPVTARHQGVVVQLVFEFECFNRAHLHGFVGVAASDVVLDRALHLVLQPDAYIVGPDRVDIVGKDVDGPPDLVVEVLSPSGIRYDRVRKRDIYRYYGVREYWIVDPVARTIEVLHWEGGDRVELREVFAENDTARSRLWPALTVELNGIWGPPQA
jgi:Uma2 family endonuclease